MSEQQYLPTPADVGRFYDQMGPFFAILWGENIHYGYWHDPDDPSSDAEAQERLTDLMIDYTQLQAGQQLLDVGCGTGWPAIRLAQATGGTVLGITVSQTQIQQANERACSAHMNDQVRFQYADAMQLPFEANSFDAAWAFESIVHMPDRSQVLREIARVLRPGGRLVLTDIIEATPMADEQRAFFLSSFMLNSLTTLDTYPHLVQQAGLELEQLRDLKTNTQPTIARLNAALLRKADSIRDQYGPELLTMMTQSLPVFAALQRENLSYIILVARKPAICGA
jgi:cyclopropane fatty-acyl-phospholipid synthase-like methyltransferase